MDAVNILALNAGSSSLKFALFDAGQKRLLSGHQELSNTGYGAAVQAIKSQLEAAHLLESPLLAIGQRVVHGGTHFHEAVKITSPVKDRIRELSDLAPLHNPPALETINAAESVFPGIPQVAVFDTAYFQHLPEHEIVYPLPYEWYASWGIRRFGFHGISHRYCAEKAAELLRRPGLRVVSCHLGQGCSATASRDGRAVATTMGFTPLDGLMMGSRPGSIDPGILVYVQRKHHLTPETLDDLLNHQAGVLGISGISNDFREIERAAEAGHKRASLALTMFVERVRAAVGAFAVTLGGIDALVFTGGVGEHSALVRSLVCRGLECLQLHLDSSKNGSYERDSDIAQVSSPGRILVIETQEELLIAREARTVLGHTWQRCSLNTSMTRPSGAR